MANSELAAGTQSVRSRLATRLPSGLQHDGGIGRFPPGAGQRPLPHPQPRSLAGCGTGGRIAPRGVNFEFNESTLTLNAEATLDSVALEV